MDNETSMLEYIYKCRSFFFKFLLSGFFSTATVFPDVEIVQSVWELWEQMCTTE